MNLRAPFLVSLLSTVLPAFTQGEFPEIYNSEPNKAATPPPPSEALAAFGLPDGFQATVFAAEQDVRNPIAMTWDRHGRIWVAENYTYAESAKRFDLTLRDRVLVFEDSDGDGKADVRTVFHEDLQMLTSVEVGRGGVWLMCPPRLLFIPDRDEDAVPDGEPQVVLDGFTVAQNNYHNLANGLRWGPDGWLYGRCGGSCPGQIGVPGTPAEERVPLEGGIWRFHPERKFIEVLTHGTTNSWGHDWDENGQGFFINTVNGHLWHLIPGAHFERPFVASPNPLVYEPVGMHADHWHFDTGSSWMKSRDGAANDFGGGHSHIGMCIYQGDQLPASWQGKLLTWNQHGRRLNVERLEPHGNGYVARHEPDAFLAGDEWFRGLDIRSGPEGALYALDWSDTGECHEHTGVHRESGRIYRFSYGDAAKPDLAKLALGRALVDPNPWFERQVRKDLKASPANIATATDLLDSDAATSQRLRALWALNAMGAPGRSKLVSLLDDPDEHLRVWAIRLLTDTWPIDSIYGPMPHRTPPDDPALLEKLTTMAADDSSGLVRLTLASTLQRLPLASRPALAAALSAREEDAADHNLPKLVWFGISPLRESGSPGMVTVAEASTWPDLVRWIARSLAEKIEADPAPVAALIEIALASPEKAPPVFGGLTGGFKGWRKAPQPANWDRAVLAYGHLPPVRDLSALFGDGRATETLKALALDGGAELAARETALRTLIENRADGLRALCESLLDTRQLNKTAVRGLAVFDDPAIGRELASNYGKRFQPRERAPVVDVLVSRTGWASALLEQVGSGKISRTDISPFHARQILAHDDEKLSSLLHQVWGEARPTGEAKRQRIEALAAELTPGRRAGADLSSGRALFHGICASCHQLYGQGGKLGPDLTGSGRSDLGYLLENTVDPSAVVSAEYRMSVLALKDGRILSGVVAAQNDRTLTLRQLTEETTLEKSEIAQHETLPVSVMPESLLDALTADQRRDLIAYLMHPTQVDLPE